MNYRAHIPAGIAWTSAIMLMSGQPLQIPFILGGAFGGALPDIDHEGSAIFSIGEKTAQAAANTHRIVHMPVLHALTRLSVAIFAVIDHIIMGTVGKLWNWLAHGPFTTFYKWCYRTFGKSMGWKYDKNPAAHRGGFTHSFLFLIGSSIITLIPSLLMGSLWFWAGCEVGILSHLYADAQCKSGVKFFWPFAPKIGFTDTGGQNRGRDIRLISPKLQMSTGYCTDRSEYLELPRNSKEYKLKKKYYWLETGWRILFKALAILFIILTVAGIGIGSGALAWNSNVIPITGKAKTLAAQNGGTNGGQGQTVTDTQKQSADAQSQYDSDSSNMPTSDVSGTNSSNGNDSSSLNTSATVTKKKDGTTTVAESKGPTSLTYGDLSVTELPKGIVKLPDESLWIVNIGPVNETNLNDPRCSYTDDEKARLLQAANAQRIAELRGTASDALKAAGDSVGDAIDNATNALNEAGNTATNGATNSGNAIINFLNSITGLNIGTNANTDGLKKGPQWGFIGLTPYTSS